MMNVIVFSKDRPAQLELLLSSMSVYYREFYQTNIHVIYRSSNESFANGYRHLKAECAVSYNNVIFVDEDDHARGTFYSLVSEVITSNHHLNYTMFLVDDIIFRSHFSLQDKECSALRNENVLCLSLRLYDQITHCYATNSGSPPPQYMQTDYVSKIWNWRDAPGDWGYPMSLDGNVYRTNTVLHLLDQLQKLMPDPSAIIYNPNTLESVMNLPQITNALPNYMASYDFSKLLNNPANRVQNQFANRSTDKLDVYKTNELFLSGSRLRPVHNLEKLNNNTVHYDIDVCMKGP